MVRINNHNYLENNKKNNTWLGKHKGKIDLGYVYVPVRLIGKRIRFKIEIVRDQDLNKEE